MNRLLSILLCGVVVLGLGGLLLSHFLREPAAEDGRPAGAPALPIPVITVEAVYPGANASVVADTIAAPIEQEVSGVEGMRWMRSQSTNEGTYRLAVAFDPRTDLDMALVHVQNRVALATPTLPDEVKRAGVTVKHEAPTLLTFLVVSSPEARHDLLFLSNYATLRVKEPLALVAGVGDVKVIGTRNPNLRVVLDPEKLAARKLTALDVTKALQEQNLQVAPRKEKDAPIQLSILGRWLRTEDIADVVVQAKEEGEVVRLKDVGQVEIGGWAPETRVDLNGKPVVLVGVYLSRRGQPHEVNLALQEKVKELRRHLPEGVDLGLAFDFSRNLAAPDRNTPEYLRLDLQLPDGASAERTEGVTARCSKLLRETVGVQDVLSIHGEPVSAGTNQASLLISLGSPALRKTTRDEVMKGIRARLKKEVTEAASYLCDLTGESRFPAGGYALELVVEDRGDKGHVSLQQVADDLVEKLRKSEKWADVRVRPDCRAKPVLYVEIDRTKVQAQGLTMKDVLDTLQVALGEKAIGKPMQFGRTVTLTFPPDTRGVEDFRKLQVRNNNNQAVALGTVLSVRDTDGPVVRERFNLYPAVTILANPAPGVSVDEARRVADALAEKELPAAFHLEWVGETASKKK